MRRPRAVTRLFANPTAQASAALLIDVPKPTCCMVRTSGRSAPRLLERAALETQDHGILVDEAKRARDDIVAPIARRALQLDHHADPASAEIEHFLEQRVAATEARRVVDDDEVADRVGTDVELDVVGA